MATALVTHWQHFKCTKRKTLHSDWTVNTYLVPDSALSVLNLVTRLLNTFLHRKLKELTLDYV